MAKKRMVKSYKNVIDKNEKKINKSSNNKVTLKKQAKKK